MPVTSRAQRRAATPARRAVAFRLLAVGLGLSTVLLLEGALRLTAWGRAADGNDPFVGFSGLRPLFVLSDDGRHYEIPEPKLKFFQPERFAAQKAPDEFRIFCLGGSTVQGRPYSIETSFTTWLELSLQAADPSRRWEVVNCGGVSYASYRLVPIMQEALAYRPDLFVVYTGHNEFLEERSYGRVKHSPAWLQSLHEFVAGWRIYGLCQSAWLKTRGSRETAAGDRQARLAADVDALLDYQGGLSAYERDDAWRDGVIAHFEHNLRRMTRIARQAGVPLILVNPVSNLRDCPPFKCQPRDDLTSSQSEAFQELWQQAKEMDWERLDRKIAILRQALALDDRYADAHFLLAKCHYAGQEYASAMDEFIRAKDEDICPLRILQSMHEVIARVARQSGTPLVDVCRLFAEATPHGIPGEDLLIDHVHPRIEGHQQIAQALLAEMVRQGWAKKPRPGWEAERVRLFDLNLQSLEPSYFPESLERLRGLQRWTQGRVQRVRSEPRHSLPLEAK